MSDSRTIALGVNGRYLSNFVDFADGDGDHRLLRQSVLLRTIL